MPTKKKATEKAKPKAKPESVIAEELNVPSEPIETLEESVPDFAETQVGNDVSHKKLFGNSRIWANPLLASQNKSFERHFFLESDAELGLGTVVFGNDSLSEPFCGSDGYITLSATEGENNPKWCVCKIDQNGLVKEFIPL